MPDETQGAGASTTIDQQPQDTTPDAGAPDAPSQPTTDAKPDTSANKLIKDFVKQRGITVEDLIQQFTTFEDASKTEHEKLLSRVEQAEAERDTLRATIRDTQAEAAFLDAAQKANAVAPKTLFRAYKSELEYDDDGSVTNLAAVIEKAQADEPTLFRASTGSADGGRKGESTTDKMTMNDVLREMAKTTPR